MSKDIKHLIALQYLNGEPQIVIEVDDLEYKDMIRSMRATDDAKSIWIRDKLGTIYNMNLVKSFHVIDTIEE